MGAGQCLEQGIIDPRLRRQWEQSEMIVFRPPRIVNVMGTCTVIVGDFGSKLITRRTFHVRLRRGGHPLGL